MSKRYLLGLLLCGVSLLHAAEEEPQIEEYLTVAQRELLHNNSLHLVEIIGFEQRILDATPHDRPAIIECIMAYLKREKDGVENTRD